MKRDRQHIMAWVGVNACRFLVGVLFLFSGFVKAIDPVGFYLKLNDYLTALGFPSWINGSLLMLSAIAISSVEFYVGICMLLGIRRKVVTTLALVLMCVMTPLTLYLAWANPVSDCGCFGDAWILTNWETFIKNLFLLVATVILFRWRSTIYSLVTPKLAWMVSIYSLLFVITLSFYCLFYLPIIDFRPYRIGTDIRRAMSIPEGAQPDVWESYVLMEKEGTQKEFRLEEYPDSTWKYISTRNLLVKKGYEPPIQDFSLRLATTHEEMTDSILSFPGYTFLLVAHRLEEADDSHVDLINEIYDYSVEHGYAFYALTSSPMEEIELWCERTGGEYPFCEADDTMLKTMIRSNPGLLLLHDGVIVNKWSGAALPDEYVLTAPLEEIEAGAVPEVSAARTVGYVLLWFMTPLLFILALDMCWVRQRNKKVIINP